MRSGLGIVGIKILSLFQGGEETLLNADCAPQEQSVSFGEQAMSKYRGIVCALVLGVGLSQAGSSRAEAWKFIVSGDSRGSDNGVNTTILAEIAQQTIAQNAEFILMPGDLVNGYTTETNLQSQLLTWRNTMQPVYAEGIGVYPVRGNHEKGGSYGVPTAWNNVFADLTGSGGLDYRLPQNGPAGEENLTWSFTHGTGNDAHAFRPVHPVGV